MTINRCFNTICLIFVSGFVGFFNSHASADVIFSESFSGTGPYTANGGSSGFENPGWSAFGNDGTFTTNSLGEQVYAITSQNAPAMDGVYRLVGPDAMEVVAEFSNVQFGSPGFAKVGVQLTDIAGSFLVEFDIFNDNDGKYVATLAALADGQSYFPAELDLGTSVDQITMRAIAQPDLISGGSRFDYWVDVNESGHFQYVGFLDGSIYTENASPIRTMFIGNFPVSKTVYSELDQLSISSIPEPTTAVLLTIVAMGMAIGTRRHR